VRPPHGPAEQMPPFEDVLLLSSRTQIWSHRWRFPSFKSRPRISPASRPAHIRCVCGATWAMARGVAHVARRGVASPGSSALGWIGILDRQALPNSQGTSLRATQRLRARCYAPPPSTTARDPRQGRLCAQSSSDGAPGSPHPICKSASLAVLQITPRFHCQAKCVDKFEFLDRLALNKHDALGRVVILLSSFGMETRELYLNASYAIAKV
jgi:hypothetical protein